MKGHCNECGALLANAGEYHPFAFCVLKKAGLDPWAETRQVAFDLGLGPTTHRPPLVKSLSPALPAKSKEME